MAATTSTASTPGRQFPSEPVGPRTVGVARAAVLLTIGTDVALIVFGSVAQVDQLLEVWPDIAIWTVAAAVVGIAAVQTQTGPQLGMDMPILLAAGFVLGPIPAGVIAFAGYVDIRELRGQISLERALFNRAQTSLSVMAAAGLFDALSNSSSLWPDALAAAFVAVAIDCVMNYGLVGCVIALHERVSTRASLARLRVGPLIAFVTTYACFGLLSLLLAEVFIAIGPSGLLLFALPIVLARQAFSSELKLDNANGRLRAQEVALRDVSERIIHERRDERMLVAAGLHDDVLPPLYRVHLLGQVLRQELATGQLLAMEDDLPALLRATDEASDSCRHIIQSLRRSTLGTEGLARTLRLLLREMEVHASAAFRVEIEEVRATPVVELLAFQVAREALRNSVQYSRASTIWFSLQREEDCLRLTIEDDGQGFHPQDVDDSKHFGIALMRERVDLAGGVMQLDSAPGAGTRVVAKLPVADARQQ